MKTPLFFLFVLLTDFESIAQSVTPQQLRARFALEKLSARNGLGMNDLAYGIPLPPGGVIGNTYLDDKWNVASFIMAGSDQMVEGYPMKYDIKGNQVEIKTKSTVKVIDVKKIKNLVWMDSLTLQPKYFVNAQNYNLDGTPIQGLLEIIVDGSFPLFKRTVVTEQPPNYVPALDVGSRDAKITKKAALYYADNKELIKVTNKKSFWSAFKDKATEMQAYTKSNSLDVKKESDLIKIFEYYNSKFAPLQNEGRGSE